MGNAITQEARALWLMLMRNGGWWTVSELTHHWRPTFQSFEVLEALEALKAGNFLDSRIEVSGKRSYAFTTGCNRLPELVFAEPLGAHA